MPASRNVSRLPKSVASIARINISTGLAGSRAFAGSNAVQANRCCDPAVLEGHRFGVASMAFGRDGRRVVTGSRNRTARAATEVADPLAAIQKAITTRKIPARVIGPAKRRQLDETAPLAFALVAALSATLHLSLGEAYQLLRRMPSAKSAGDHALNAVAVLDSAED